MVRTRVSTGTGVWNLRKWLQWACVIALQIKCAALRPLSPLAQVVDKNVGIGGDAGRSASNVAGEGEMCGMHTADVTYSLTWNTFS